MPGVTKLHCRRVNRAMLASRYDHASAGTQPAGRRQPHLLRLDRVAGRAGSACECSCAGAELFRLAVSWTFSSKTFGLDRTAVSSLYGAGTFVASLSLTWVGRQIDLWGNRRVGAVTVCSSALCWLLCSLISGPDHAVLRLRRHARTLGQGALTLVGSTAVANWFRFRRGRMMSLAGAVTFALVSGHLRQCRCALLLETMDWRQVFVCAGMLAWRRCPSPPSRFLMRDRPEHYGLKPDMSPLPISRRERVRIKRSRTIGRWRRRCERRCYGFSSSAHAAIGMANRTNPAPGVDIRRPGA